MSQFAILHQTKESQILIDSEYDPTEDIFRIRVKFWSGNVNGHVSVSQSWAAEHEKDYKKFFGKLKDINYAILFCEGITGTKLTL